jgi:hypothetical protein
VSGSGSSPAGQGCKHLVPCGELLVVRTSSHRLTDRDQSAIHCSTTSGVPHCQRNNQVGPDLEVPRGPSRLCLRCRAPRRSHTREVSQNDVHSPCRRLGASDTESALTGARAGKALAVRDLAQRARHGRPAVGRSLNLDCSAELDEPVHHFRVGVDKLRPGLFPGMELWVAGDVKRRLPRAE